MQNTKNTVEQESRMFWRLAADLTKAFEAGEPVTDILDELDVLSIYTDSPKLKERILGLYLDYSRRSRERKAVGVLA